MIFCYFGDSDKFGIFEFDFCDDEEDKELKMKDKSCELQVASYKLQGLCYSLAFCPPCGGEARNKQGEL
jgi:hypothetical protein